MRSTFYGFEIAKTGVFAAQRYIDLTGHNIANANTVGYSRQRLVLDNAEIATGGAKVLEVIRGYSGTGVRTQGVEQLRNAFLDRQYRNEYGSYEMWNARSEAMTYIEDLFNESGESGLSKSISSFFSAAHKLTENPESKEYRTNLMQNALLMTDDFKHLATQLVEKQAEQNEAVRVSAIQINDIANNIADLNNQIFRYELSGEAANDLRDKRNNLLDELSGIADITYTEDDDGMLTVELGGVELVNRLTATTINYAATTPNPIAGQANLYTLTWDDGTGTPVTVTTGKLRSYMDMRDGDSAADIGIPYIMHKLDTLSSTIATEVNAIHNAGYTLPDASNGNTSVNGVDFFNEPAGGVTALNFTLDAAITASVFNIAASGNQITDDTLRGDNTNAVKLDELQNKIDIAGIGSIEGYLKGFVAELGVETSHTAKMLEGEQTLIKSLTNQRTSVSGVSIDEEMTNLIKFQQSYAASARVITTIDEYLDVLINKMGIVGR